MFRFAKKSDYLYMLLGSICSALMGAVLPVFSYLWGSMANSFSDSDKMVNDALMIFIEYLAFGVGAIFAGWGMQYFWLVAGESQANECRKEFIASLMRQ
jgi:ATP-binding cassette subfamily B (MDR/TAP) protein 1